MPHIQPILRKLLSNQIITDVPEKNGNINLDYEIQSKEMRILYRGHATWANFRSELAVPK